ncbi:MULTISPECIES: FxsA family protein [unclassified Streptomyces]|uniref:FxsA family protein n=1 Tax=unclassified Streptomyces TaxID=2593676 RepID=UPI00136CBBA0|nr:MULTISPECIES: FxsA family protein [unclassified Streptomyces]MYS23748.1 FxsA family protein [Streptomyces sp. SID4948]
MTAHALAALGVAVWVGLEIWAMIVVAYATNGFVVLLILLAGYLLGAGVARRAGLGNWDDMTATLKRLRRRRPAPEGEQSATAPRKRPIDSKSGLQLLGGLLLIIPGFLSDVVALVVLFPPVRKLIGAATGGARR